MQKENKLFIASAGSGKTTLLINKALEISDRDVLITTYTQSNEAEIRKKILAKNKFIPGNLTIQTWVSFLMQHGVRPYQGSLFDKSINGYLQMNEKSGYNYINQYGQKVYFGEENNFEDHYFSKSHKIYSDKLSKFVVKCDKASNGNVIDRLTRIYSTIFIDEVQDLAGYDLEVLKLLFKSRSNVFLFGDPRQVVYLTHNESKYGKYAYGRIKSFVTEQCKKNEKCDIDEVTLKKSHRNNLEICLFSSKLFPLPEYSVSEPCSCEECRKNSSTHNGIFLIRTSDIESYLKKHKQVVQLRLQENTKGVHPNFSAMNFGVAKGLTFDRTLIFPTDNMRKWIKDEKQKLEDKTRSQFYVAITRARYSVGIVYDYTEDESFIEGVKKFPE